MIHMDGSSTQKRGRASVIIASPGGDILKYEVQLKFPVINNEVEYEAILTGLKIARALGAKNALLKSDSQLVLGQVKGDLRSKGNKDAEIPQVDEPIGKQV